MTKCCFVNGVVISTDQLVSDAGVLLDGGRIVAIGPTSDFSLDRSAAIIDLDGNYLAPGFVDLHVHGGAGADFMDGTADAFRTVCQAHARHGTTSLLPTSCAAHTDRFSRSWSAADD